MTRIKTLNVRKVTVKEINKHCPGLGFMLPGRHTLKDIYIRCRADGTINWKSNWIYYHQDELIERNNVRILTKPL